MRLVFKQESGINSMHQQNGLQSKNLNQFFFARKILSLNGGLCSFELH